MKQLQRLSSLALYDINTFKFSILWALVSPRDHYVLNITCLSCSENLEEHFSLKLAPHGGRIFRSGISVPPLEDPYACAVFRSILV